MIQPWFQRWTMARAALVGWALSSAAACGESSGTEGGPARPDSAAEPLYLTYKGRTGTPAEAKAYMKTVGELPSPALWEAAHCFLGNEDPLMYFNKVDLGFGRGLRWSECGERFAACVNNFGEPGAREVEGLHALQSESKVAVCMDHDPGRGAGFETQFYVFENDAPATGLAFDRQGVKLSPFACTACHGGKLVNFDVNGKAVYMVKGAQFLPLLMESITFDHPTIAFEEDRIREWNAIVYKTATSAGIRTVLDAAYPGPSPGQGVGTIGQEYNLDQVPSEWQAEAEYYQVLLFSNCLTCHVAHPEPVFDPKNEALRRVIQNLVCTTQEMPNSVEGQNRLFGRAIDLADCPQ